MDEDLIEGLKQFITAAVSQATADLATKADLEAVRADLEILRGDMKQGFADVNLKLDTIADAHAEDIADHEQP